jgi:hypothetical protein
MKNPISSGASEDYIVMQVVWGFGVDKLSVTLQVGRCTLFVSTYGPVWLFRNGPFRVKNYSETVQISEGKGSAWNQSQITEWGDNQFVYNHWSAGFFLILDYASLKFWSGGCKNQK